jgi:hypothetical protein
MTHKGAVTPSTVRSPRHVSKSATSAGGREFATRSEATDRGVGSGITLRLPGPDFIVWTDSWSAFI